MPQYNPNIELGIHDMDLIEDALRHAKQRLSIPGGPDADAAIAGRAKSTSCWAVYTIKRCSFAPAKRHTSAARLI